MEPLESQTPAAEALQGTRAHFRSGATRPLSWREAQISAVLRLVRENEADLVEALRNDLRKPPTEAMLELSSITAEGKAILASLPDWMTSESVSTPLVLQPASSFIYFEPLGVCLIIGAWNFPISLVLTPLLSALAAGNCAVLKPSEVAPHSSSILASLVPQYLDSSAVCVVEGGVDITTELLQQNFDHIFFTGSSSIGKIVMRAAAEHLTPVVLELGGKNPVIVESDASIEVAANRICWGKCMNAGQLCVAPDYLLVHESVKDKLVSAMKDTFVKFFGNDPKESPDLGRIVNDKHMKRLASLLDNQTVVFGGDYDEEELFFSPTLVDNPDPKSKIMQDEIFGPILPILTYSDISEAIAFIVDRPKPLGLYLFSNTPAVQQRVLRETSSGGACINDVVVQINSPNMPFGGVGQSGMGGYHGQYGFLALSNRKSVVHQSTIVDPSIRYPPYTTSKNWWLGKLV